MKRNLGILLAVVALGAGITAGGGAASGGGNPLASLPYCVDGSTQAQFDVYGYYDGRTADQLFSIVFRGDPNGAVVNGRWVQQLPPGVFADYDALNNAYVIHHVRLGRCLLTRTYP